MRFEDCYPQEIIEWIDTLPAPDACTERQRHIAGLMESPEVISLGRGLLLRLRDAANRNEATAMIENFKILIHLAH